MAHSRERSQRGLGMGSLLEILVVTLACGVLSQPAFGQGLGANVGGVVTDESGASVPGVSMTITNKSNGRTQTLVTGPQGNYRAVALSPAPYEIKAELQGFAPVMREITLTVGADATVDFRLEVGTLEENLTVVAEAPLVEIAKSQPSSVVVGEQITTLPVLERNFMTLAQLLPGTGPNPVGGKFGLTKFGGIADQSNGYTTIIDGGDIDDAIFGTPIINLSQDSVQEFKVFRNQFDAEYGTALSSVVTVVTKSGSNQFSGAVSSFGRDRRFNAKNVFATTKPAFSQWRHGGTFGGPIALNRTHFFGAYEYNDVNTAKIIALSASNPFASRESGIFPSGSTNHMGVAKVDHRFNDAHSLFVRYVYDNQTSLRINNVTSDSNNSDDVSRAHSLIGEETWTLSQNMVNSFRVHFFKHFSGSTVHSTDLNIVRPSVQTGQATTNPQFFPRTKLSMYDTMYINLAQHDLRIGGEFALADTNFEAHHFEHGSFQFTTDAPFSPDNPSTWPISFVQQTPGFYNYKSKQLALYLQDNWRVGGRVRLNLGVRYDLDTNLRLNEFYRDLLDDPRYAGLERFISKDRGTDTNNVQPRLGVTWDARGTGNLIVRGGWGMYVTRNRPWFQVRAMNQSLASAVRIETPAQLRLYPDINAVLGGRSLDEFIGAGGPRSLGTVIPDNAVLPYSTNTTGGVGWQINPTTSLDVDVVHVIGEHQLGGTDRNLPVSGRISTTNPRPVAAFSKVSMLENYSKSWYDALETQLRTRVRGAENLQLSYTLSRTYLDGVNFFLDERGTQRTPDERGYHITDQRHNLTFAGATTLPGRVQVSGIIKWISGSPMKVQAGFDIDGDGSLTGDRPPGLPRTVGREKVEESLRIINELRASRNLPPINKDLLKLDPFRAVDVRVSRAFSLGGDRRIELLVEAFNLTNFKNFQPNTVNVNIISPAFLVRTTASDARQIQWGVRYLF